MDQPNASRNMNSIFLHDRKPIHLPGTIQPHGILLAFRETDFEIQWVSHNTQSHLGIAAQDLLGHPLSSLLDSEQIEAVRVALQENLGRANRLQFLLAEQWFDGMLHHTETGAILELERSHPSPETFELTLSRSVRKAIAKLQKLSGLTEFLQGVVEEVRQITGFDRVHIYRFDPQGAGDVIAEAKVAELDSFLGLHFPATDIPTVSRDLYKRCNLRCSPDVSAAPIELLSLEQDNPPIPLDLSLAILRSVDPCCVEYYENMGSAAFLAIALIKDRQLWGLISCHHQTPKPLPYELRSACELLAQFASLDLSTKANHQEWDNLIHFKALHSEFIESISHAESLSDALITPVPRLLELVAAQGAAVCLDNDITLVGETPTLEQVRDLIEWTQQQGNESLFQTDSLPKLYPEADAFKETASGLLSLRISKVRRYSILWFRPEVLQTINWAGNPNDAFQVEANGEITLCPRNSFKLWQETVRLTSLPWKSYELTNALDLRNAIVGIVLTKADELAKMNRELERSNRELDSFAFAASHDLREPLRGIHNYSTILQEDYAQVLDTEGAECLQTIKTLTQRMDTLISVLLKFSQLGQAELDPQKTDLNDVLRLAIEVVQASRPNPQFEVRIPRPLPIVQCDAVMVNELFCNLLSNAFKYNNKAQGWAEIGYFNGAEQIEKGWIKSRQQDSIPLLFYLQDNGIGMRSHHLEIVFKLFKRLHAQEEYGGGTGAGLTITRKVVERHGGRIWVESIYGEGSTFYFTLE
jgi:two-component system, chemotaxis family, sensor kinase Cph1